MDDVLEENIPNHALQEQRDTAQKWRNVGIGIMGLHDAFIKMGYRYGDFTSCDFTDNLMAFIFKNAVLASAKLGKERGNFPGYSSKVWQASILNEVFNEDEIQKLKKQGHLRNCSLLSIAPTGSIGTMFNVSTGIEPYFSSTYTRHTKSLDGQESSYEVKVPIFQEALANDWHPECLVTSNDIPWKHHINIQAAAQIACDTSISKTINMPKGTTPEEIEKLYSYAWTVGLKGVTVYVDGSRDPILETKKEKEETCSTRGSVAKAEDNCIGLKRTLMTGCGTLHLTAFFNPTTGDLVETYLSKGSTGGCNNFMIGLSRMMSLAARGGISVENIIDQLKSCGSCPSYAVRKATKNDTSLGSCCPVAIGNALLEMHKEFKERINLSKPLSTKKEEVEGEVMDKCPECGSKLEHSTGCVSCPSCGFARCG